MKKILSGVILIASLNTGAVLGPIPIYLNTEYRTNTPVIGSIASTLIFNADDITATGANTFLEFLATVPSVGLVNPPGSPPALFMRGGDSDHTLVLIDGVSINSADSLDGAVEYGLTSIALNDIEKVEIIKNSGSVLYGSSAIAGVINITTKKGIDATNTIDIKFGAHNAKTYTLLANGGNKDGFIRFTHNKYTTDGINSQTGDTTGEKDGMDNHTTQIKVGNQHFDLSYLQSRNKTEYDGFGGIDANELADTKFNKLAVNVNKRFNRTWKSQLLLAQTKSKTNTGTNAETIGYDYKTITLTSLNDISINNALLTVGLSAVEDKNTANNLKHTSTDLFANWQKNINDLDLNTGVRYIKHNKFGYHHIYNMGIARELKNGIRLVANYNTAFQAPTLKNLYGWDFTGISGGGNPKLKPETSKNINIGLTKSHAWGEIGLSLFKSKEKDSITWVGVFPNAIYENQGSYTAKGIELLLDANIHGYNIKFDHTYAKSRVKDSNTQAIRRPKNITNLTIGKKYNKFNSQAQIIRKSASLDFGNVELKGYTLINLSNSYTVDNSTKVLLNIKNITDKDYTVANGYNQAGRTFEVGLNYQF